MPRGDKSSYTNMQKRQARPIEEEGYESRRASDHESERRTGSIVNADATRKGYGH